MANIWVMCGSVLYCRAPLNLYSCKKLSSLNALVWTVEFRLFQVCLPWVLQRMAVRDQTSRGRAPVRGWATHGSPPAPFANPRLKQWRSVEPRSRNSCCTLTICQYLPSAEEEREEKLGGIAKDSIFTERGGTNFNFNVRLRRFPGSGRCSSGKSR